MRRSMCAILCCLALASIQPMRAADLVDAMPDESVEKQPGERAPEILPPGTAHRVDSDRVDSGRDHSRYRWHEGHWWYRIASGQWLMWNGERWRSVSPSPQSPPSSSRRQWAVYRAPSNLPPMLRPTNHGWVGGFYSSGGGYGTADFGYGYGIPTYGPYQRP